MTPLTLLTGFLGAGKTTLLNRLLRDPALEGSAVLVNEFGEIGLDHLFVEALEGDAVLLASGCLCCTIRGDLSRALRDLAARGRPFRRVVVETTGLADPAPILHTLMRDPLLLRDYALDGVVTVLDAVAGMASLDAHEEARRQAAVADLLLIGKSDLADPAPLAARLAVLNPVARIADARDVPAQALLGLGPFSAEGKAQGVAAWIEGAGGAHLHHHHHDPNRHDARIRALCLRFDAPLPWEAVAGYLEMMAMTQGARLLRVKGVLDVRGEALPVVVHGVQHSFHPPRRLPAWPAEEPRGSRLVFILQDLEPAVVEQGLRAFLEAAA
jgi:G3E family GTPase